MTVRDIELVRGDTYAFNFQTSTRLDGAYFSAKKTINKNDTNYIFHKSFEDGIALIEEDPENDVFLYSVRVAPEDTNDLDIGVWNYDLQLMLNDDVYTPLSGKLKIVSDVTREGAI